MKKSVVKLSLILLVVLVGFSACQDELTDPGVKVKSLTQVVPVLSEGGPGGNTSCELASQVLGLAEGHFFEFSTDRVSVEDINVNSFPGFSVTISADGKYLTWNFTPPAGYCLADLVVIVKGGNASYLYYYQGNVLSGNGLVSPINDGNNIPTISNLTFCYNLVPCEKCWKGETAWSDGPRYVTKGNWGTYTAYTGSYKKVKLYAGKDIEAGCVEFAAPSGGTVKITITLKDKFRFALVDENVKIQCYSSKPEAKNPIPGGFDHKYNVNDSPFCVNLPQAAFYGIHVDIDREIACD
jgi:hypothetical protein